MKQSKVKRKIAEGWLKVLYGLPTSGCENLEKTIKMILGK